MTTKYKIVLLRHGESTWNKENRFTGWTDVDLSEKGIEEAHWAGKVCSIDRRLFFFIFLFFFTFAGVFFFFARTKILICSN